MKTVKVYGALRELLGQCRFELDVVTPGQAIRALIANFPQLERWLLDSEKDGVAYRVTVGKQKATEEDVSPLLLPFGEREVFSITPVIAGAGRGVGAVLLGAALIATAVFTGGATLAFGFTGFTGGLGISAVVGNIGVGLLLTGVSQLLSPTPAIPQGPDTVQDPRKSFSFSGIQNTSRGGTPVPIVYGKTLTGSVVISAGIDTEQVQA